MNRLNIQKKQKQLITTMINLLS